MLKKYKLLFYTQIMFGVTASFAMSHDEGQAQLPDQSMHEERERLCPACGLHLPGFPVVRVLLRAASLEAFSLALKDPNFLAPIKYCSCKAQEEPAVEQELAAEDVALEGKIEDRS